MRYDDYRRPSFFMRILHAIAAKFPWLTALPITRPIGFVLFIIAWSTGAVSGILAWALLLLFMDFHFNINRN